MGKPVQTLTGLNTKKQFVMLQMLTNVDSKLTTATWMLAVKTRKALLNVCATKVFRETADFAKVNVAVYCISTSLTDIMQQYINISALFTES